MKNTATFETALKLKEAGFPQPEPEAGQFWYNPDFGLFLVGRRSFIDGRMRNIFYFETGKSYDKEDASFADCIFAPTATDILRELKDNIPNLVCTHRPKNNGATFVCYYSAHQFISDDNPAEAAAIAWLKINSKK